MATTERLARRMEHWMRQSTLQVRITHPIPGSAADLSIDPDTDEVVDAEDDDAVYRGIALLAHGVTVDDVAGAEPVARETQVLHIPRRASVPEDGDEVLVVSCSKDPAQVGRRLTASAVKHGPLYPTRRLEVAELVPTRPR